MELPKLIITLDQDGIATVDTERFPPGFTFDITVKDLHGETEHRFAVPDCGPSYFLQDPDITWDEIFKHCTPMADHILWSLLPKHIQLHVLETSATVIRNMVCNSEQVIKNLNTRWTERISNKLWEGLQDIKITYAEEAYTITDVLHEMQDDSRGFKISLPKLRILPEKTSALEPGMIVDPSDPKFKFRGTNIDDAGQKDKKDASEMTFAEYQQLQTTESVRTKDKSDQTSSNSPIATSEKSKLTIAERMKLAKEKILKAEEEA